MKKLLLLFIAITSILTLGIAQNSLQAPIQIVRIVLNGQGYIDETVVYTDSSATMGFDGQLDAIKTPNFDPAPTFASIIDNGNTILSINAIPPLAVATTIPLSLTTGASGAYTMDATQLSGFQTGDDVVLEDTQLQISQSLFANPIYAFTLNSGDPDGRFFLNLLPEDITTGLNHSPDSEPIFSFNDKNIHVSSSKGFSLSNYQSIRVFDLLGKELAKTSLQTENKTIIKMPPSFGGICLISLYNNNEMVTFKKYFD